MGDNPFISTCFSGQNWYRLEVRSRRLRNKGQAATVEPDRQDDTISGITNTKGTTDTERSRRSDRFYPVMRVVYYWLNDILL
jgi:hypothetical protein